MQARLSMLTEGEEASATAVVSTIDGNGEPETAAAPSPVPVSLSDVIPDLGVPEEGTPSPVAPSNPINPE